MGCIWPICVILSDVFRVRYKRTADLIMDQIAKIPVWETRTAWEGRKWAVIQSTDQCVTCLTMQCSWWTMFVYLLTKALPSKINPWITRLTRWTEHVYLLTKALPSKINPWSFFTVIWLIHKLGQTQMVMFFVVKLTYSSLNTRFDGGVTYLQLIIFSVVGNVPIDSETLFDRLCES
jgi:hypothetical protein